MLTCEQISCDNFVIQVRSKRNLKLPRGKLGKLGHKAKIKVHLDLEIELYMPQIRECLKFLALSIACLFFAIQLADRLTQQLLQLKSSHFPCAHGRHDHS